jgi:predicted TIM-barrel fold metal-dependent hydrolase
MSQKIDPTAGVPFTEPADPNPRRPSFTLPPRACDAHAHLFGPMSRYKYYERRIYTPAYALLGDYDKLHAALGVERAVLVQPSPYGLDNSALLDALRETKREFRGIVVIGEDTPRDELERMHELGVRGIRLNIVDTKDDKGVMPVERMRALAEKIAPLGWHIEMLAHVNEFPDLDRLLAPLPIDFSFGHLGYVPTELGPKDPGFQALLRLAADGRAWVKLTGPYRISGKPHPYADVTPFAHALLERAPDQIVWGTDWPHVKAAWTIPMPNDGDDTSLLADWVPDEAARNKVLVDNPARLYGFPA